MNCSRKGGGTCYAIQGENRYHSIFGGMKTHVGECTKNCPAGTEISAYLQRIREGDWDGAARIVMQVNPMPMCTSRICPHPCQDDCNQGKYGECVNIHCVERTLGDYILDHADRFYPKPEQETGHKIGVIGAGPGGLTCAYYLRSLGHDVTVIDAHDKAGGVLQYGIPHYRLPRSVVDAFIAALEKMGIHFELGVTVGEDLSMDEVCRRFEKIYFGTGAWKQPILGIQGEALTTFGLDFLVEVNTYLQKRLTDEVLVCGGGNVAMDVALTAKRLGAGKVTLVCLEQAGEMPATDEEVARAKEEGVEICNGWGLKSIVTDEAGRVTGLKSMRCTAVFNDEGRFDPQYDEADTRIFDAGTVILATGQRVDTQFLGDFGAQLKTPRGLIDVDKETYQTKNDQIFAGGDVVTGPNIAIRAIRAGGIAAKTMSRQLGVPFKSIENQGFLTFDAQGVTRRENAKQPEREMAARTLADEDAATLSFEQAQAEARRCMNCGCYSVSASDISPVLVAMDAQIITTKKTIRARDFFTTKLKSVDMLDGDELVKAIAIPDHSGYQTGYIKDRIRTAIDFALMSLAYAYRLEDGKIADIVLVLGGAAPVPYRLSKVEALLLGKKPDAQLAAQAGELAVSEAVPMSKNQYKVNDVQTMVTRLVEAM